MGIGERIKSEKSWSDYLRERHEREDLPIKRFYAQFAHFGRGNINKPVPLMEKK